MKDAKNVQWISVFDYVLKLLRFSEPNAFGYCGVFGLSEAIRIRQEKTIALPIRSVDRSTQPTRTCPQTKTRRNRVLKKKLGFKLHKETFAFSIRLISLGKRENIRENGFSQFCALSFPHIVVTCSANGLTPKKPGPPFGTSGPVTVKSSNQMEYHP